jgi:mRNA-degrading endonuclease YafQ of YafQ-DinJ toxin-antitoxin module
MTGLNPYLIEKSPNFERSLKKLIKTHKSSSQKQQFIQTISNNLEQLTLNPFPPNARKEPLPSSFNLSQNWQFYKLAIVVAKGASGQIRIMYLVDEIQRIIKPIWIYNHQQFTKRPPDQDIKQIINETFIE